MTKTTFKKTIQNLTYDQLTAFLLDLYSDSKFFRDLVSSHISESDADEVLEKYVSRLEKSFNKLHSFSLNSCKAIVSEYESIAPSNRHKAIINFWFAYYAAEFSQTYGDIDSAFYNSLTKSGLKVIDYSRGDREFYEEWSSHFDDLIDICGYFGWGVQEELRRAIDDVEFKWLDEELGEELDEDEYKSVEDSP